MSNSAVINLVNSYKDMFVRYWPSLMLLVLIAATSRYLTGLSMLVLVLVSWRIHCTVFNRLQASSQNG